MTAPNAITRDRPQGAARHVFAEHDGAAAIGTGVASRGDRQRGAALVA